MSSALIPGVAAAHSTTDGHAPSAGENRTLYNPMLRPDLAYLGNGATYTAPPATPAPLMATPSHTSGANTLFAPYFTVNGHGYANPRPPYNSPFATHSAPMPNGSFTGAFAPANAPAAAQSSTVASTQSSTPASAQPSASASAQSNAPAYSCVTGTNAVDANIALALARSSETIAELTTALITLQKTIIEMQHSNCQQCNACLYKKWCCSAREKSAYAAFVAEEDTQTCQLDAFGQPKSY